MKADAQGCQTTECSAWIGVSISKETGQGLNQAHLGESNPRVHGGGDRHARLGTSTAWISVLTPFPPPQALGLRAQRAALKWQYVPSSLSCPSGIWRWTVVA